MPRKILIVKEASCRSEATCRCGNIKILIKYYLNLKFKLEIGKKVYFWSEVNLLYLRKVFHESNLSRNVTTWVADRSGSMMHWSTSRSPNRPDSRQPDSEVIQLILTHPQIRKAKFGIFYLFPTYECHKTKYMFDIAEIWLVVGKLVIVRI